MHSIACPSVLWHCWLGGRKGIKNFKWWAWLCARSEVQTCIWPSWCHCHSLSHASVKSRLVLPFWYRITWVAPEKGLLNGCVCVTMHSIRCGTLSVIFNGLCQMDTFWSPRITVTQIKLRRCCLRCGLWAQGTMYWVRARILHGKGHLFVTLRHACSRYTQHYSQGAAVTQPFTATTAAICEQLLT